MDVPSSPSLNEDEYNNEQRFLDESDIMQVVDLDNEDLPHVDEESDLDNENLLNADEESNMEQDGRGHC